MKYKKPRKKKLSSLKILRPLFLGVSVYIFDSLRETVKLSTLQFEKKKKKSVHFAILI